MDVGVDHPVVAAYLAQLDAAAASAGLSGGRRAELRAEIRAHVEAALGSGPDPADAAVADVLDRLGPVEEIVAAEMGEVATRPVRAPAGGPPPWGALEWVALGLLTVGMFVLPVVGPIAGVVCAWASTRWTRAGKILVTVLGLGIPLIVGILLAAAVGSSTETRPVTVKPAPAASWTLATQPPPVASAQPTVISSPAS